MVDYRIRNLKKGIKFVLHELDTLFFAVKIKWKM